MKDTDLAAKPETAAQMSKRLGFWYLVIFGSGGLAAFYSGTAIQALAIPVFQMQLGIEPALVGVALALPRLWDAITDPLMGNLSDNFKSRWGRRRPFVFVGAILMGLLFGLLWMVPEDWSETGQLVWLLVGSILFFTAATIFSVPLGSLYYEATPDYDERTRVMAFGAFWNRIGEVTYQWMPWLGTVFVGLGLAAGTLGGVQIVGWLVAVIFMVIPGILAAVVGRERYAKLAAQQSRVRLWPTLRSAFTNRAFLYLVVIFILTIFTGVLASVMDQYLIIYYMFEGDFDQGFFWKGWISVGYGVVGLGSIPLLTLASRRFGKDATLVWVLRFVAVGVTFRLLIYQPGNQWFLFLDPVLGGGVLWTAMSMMINSMFADICDDDELKHGQRREGMFGAAFSYIIKAGVSLTILSLGFVLSFLGFDESLGGNQSESTLKGMLVVLTAVPAVSALFCAWMLTRYPITKEKSAETRAVLETRRGKV